MQCCFVPTPQPDCQLWKPVIAYKTLLVPSLDSGWALFSDPVATPHAWLDYFLIISSTRPWTEIGVIRSDSPFRSKHRPCPNEVPCPCISSIIEQQFEKKVWHLIQWLRFMQRVNHSGIEAGFIHRKEWGEMVNNQAWIDNNLKRVRGLHHYISKNG